MDTFKVCDKCGAEIPGDAPQGRCPACLLAAGMETMGAETLLEEEIERAEPIEVDVFEEAPGKYTLIGEHARGGMGRVLLVHDESLGRDVALKELLPGRGSGSAPTPAEAQHSKEMSARFLREARITGQLEHPSITPVHEIGRREDGSLYYTMKLVKGRTLEQAIKECKTLDERLKLLPHFVDLCNAIAYAHSRNVIHRDIKPANVMVGNYGETVILDWGLAKVKDEPDEPVAPEDVDPNAATVLGINQDTPTSGHKTAMGQLLGTPVYMSPEQAKGLPADERSDIYSLGAVLYEILTGRPPFNGKTIDEIVAHVIYDEPESPRDIESRIHKKMEIICVRAIGKRTDVRFKSASSLADAVQNWKPRMEKSVLRKSIERGTVATCAVIVGILLFADWWTERKVNNFVISLQEQGIEFDIERYIQKFESSGSEEATEFAYPSPTGILESLPNLYEEKNGEIGGYSEPFFSELDGRSPATTEGYASLVKHLDKYRMLIDSVVAYSEIPEASFREAVVAMKPEIHDDQTNQDFIPRGDKWTGISSLLLARAYKDSLDGNYDAALSKCVVNLRLARQFSTTPHTEYYFQYFYFSARVYDFIRRNPAILTESRQASRELLWEESQELAPAINSRAIIELDLLRTYCKLPCQGHSSKVEFS
jgi:serine/threonine protein kinase